MYFKKETYTNDMEILVTDTNLVAFSGTVLAANVTVGDESGRKYVLAGSLIDVDGNVVKSTGTAGAETLTTTPIGILQKTVDVTDGDQACSLIVEGYVRADRVLDAIPAKAIEKIKIALPKVTFR
ncbi:MAG: hypothetical protein RSA29_17150 [Clostridium sp.]|uniref:hypothetical protein n=1 Tax=Clostridium sp. TaxID=1506 RepID=UPI00302FAB72